MGNRSVLCVGCFLILSAAASGVAQPPGGPPRGQGPNQSPGRVHALQQRSRQQTQQAAQAAQAAQRTAAASQRAAQAAERAAAASRRAAHTSEHASDALQLAARKAQRELPPQMPMASGANGQPRASASAPPREREPDEGVPPAATVGNGSPETAQAALRHRNEHQWRHGQYPPGVAHRLAEIARLRDAALATGDVSLLAAADKMEEQIRRQLREVRPMGPPHTGVHPFPPSFANGNANGPYQAPPSLGERREWPPVDPVQRGEDLNVPSTAPGFPR
ncbi:MAG: hypothetical protein FJ276_12130 [Planctomycetes bacterium]|nr:hypothetical protein [Planctomycetota bacterium]